MKRLIFDLDDTLRVTEKAGYDNAQPNTERISKMRNYQQQGFEIVIQTSSNMRTYLGNIGKIYANTLPIIIKWLNKYAIPSDEIIIGKP